MTDCPQFAPSLRAVLAAPDDDRPRLLIDHASGLCWLDRTNRKYPWRMNPPDIGG